jgi:hypothetical protein
MKNRNRILAAILSVLASFALSPMAQAAPETALSGFNTADGQSALANVTTGVANTAVGWFSLFSNTEGNFNTATGAGSLLFNTASNNTAVGAAALLFNTDGTNNTAVGTAALANNTGGDGNNAIGFSALNANASGNSNNAHGRGALEFNVDGGVNNAFGGFALHDNVSGSGNTAIGDDALRSCTGNENVGVGHGAGSLITTENNIIAIGAGVSGISTVFGGVSDSCYIGNISGQAVGSATAAIVMVDADGKLGTVSLNANGNKVALPSPQAMLNEFVKGQKRIAELEATVAQQAKAMEVVMGQLKDQAAQIQKVSVKLEMNSSAPQLAIK